MESRELYGFLINLCLLEFYRYGPPLNNILQKTYRFHVFPFWTNDRVACLENLCFDSH